METDTPIQTKTLKRIQRMKIPVTQKEIDGAVQGNSEKCMIHQSIKRDHPDFRSIYVDKSQIRFTDPKANVIYTFQMPAFARGLLLLWDDGKEIEPFDLWLRNPVVRERKLIGGAQRPKASSSKKYHGPVPQSKTEEGRVMRGRDRIFGQKLWTDELRKLRAVLEPTK